MSAFAWQTLILPTVILIAGLVDDIRSKKIHNWLVLSAIVLAAIVVLITTGRGGLQAGLLGAALALALTLPLFMARVLGGGDVKLMIAFGLASSMAAVFNVVLYSILWGALLGLIQAILSGQLMALLKNTARALTHKPTTMTNLHKIPYSVALVFAWFTQISLQYWGFH